MAGLKQFVVDPDKTIFSYEYAVVEGHEKELGHIHSHFHKDAFAPPGLLWFPYSLHYSKGFHVTSAVLYWIFVIALVVLIIRQVGFDYYFSIVLTMLGNSSVIIIYTGVKYFIRIFRKDSGMPEGK